MGGEQQGNEMGVGIVGVTIFSPSLFFKQISGIWPVFSAVRRLGTDTVSLNKKLTSMRGPQQCPVSCPGTKDVDDQWRTRPSALTPKGGRISYPISAQGRRKKAGTGLGCTSVFFL